MAGLRRLSIRMRLAMLCVVAGVLLVGIGMWKQQHSQKERWQPLNEQLAEALAQAEQQHSVVEAGEARFAEPGRAEHGLEINGNKETEVNANAEANAAEDAGTNAVSDEAAEGSGADQQAEGSSPDKDDPTHSAEAGPSVRSEAGNSSDTSGKLDLNRATAEQLDALPGIGPAKAAAIIADREAAGSFKSVDDLERVKGIGPAIVEKLRDSVVALP